MDDVCVDGRSRFTSKATSMDPQVISHRVLSSGRKDVINGL